MSSEVARIRELLAEVYRPYGVDLWLLGAKRQFGGRRPVELIENGEAGVVLAAVERLATGAAT